MPLPVIVPPAAGELATVKVFLASLTAGKTIAMINKTPSHSILAAMVCLNLPYIESRIIFYPPISYPDCLLLLFI
ncbi:hypothetical protein MBAV_000542 [Candidatus Magnetobacterium bavaricum]|uniref:Uncharacterized protein n=1 Tax=Candidatus Magnetobacterium bavaricum TaxID=29290 RepID=A0A0F3GZ94_9BACT|nr:hypothetical protein MBAV_000540 [Candidatus Magnetobacterium bavaricum]KJU87266.1 hypothetical protein MBAV_000542 [Candidatus Magnetobacterium bavaricum]